MEENKKKLVALAGLSDIKQEIFTCETYRHLLSSRDLVKTLETIKEKCDKAIKKVNEGI